MQSHTQEILVSAIPASSIGDRQLQINPSVPSNALVPSLQNVQQHADGRVPLPRSMSTNTERVSWETIEHELWELGDNELKKRKYWLNYFLGVDKCCDRQDFRVRLRFPKQSKSDFYRLAFENRKMLGENARCNLISHNNPYFEKIIMDDLYRDYLSKDCWIGLIKDNFFRKIVLLSAQEKSKSLSFFLAYADITTEELNTLLKTAFVLLH